RLNDWKMNPTFSRRYVFCSLSDIAATFFPSTQISPDVGRSSAPSKYKSVLLPDPDGPTMKANRPLPIRQLTPRSASTDRSPLRYDLRTETTSIIEDPREESSAGAEPMKINAF